MRDHEPLIIEEFNGLWSRGDIDTCPLDHFTESINIKYTPNGFTQRDGLDQLDPGTNIAGIKRIYTYNIPAGDGFLALDSSNNIWHIIPTVSKTNILTVANMTDFKMIVVNTYAIITPQNPPSAINDKCYIYRGDGVAARQVGGIQPVNADGALAAASGAAGSVEAGYHVYGVVYLTNTGFFTQIGPDTLAFLNSPGATKTNLTNVCVSPHSYVVARYIVATKVINPSDWIGDTRGQTFYFVPGGVINDNTTTSITIDFFDSALIDSTATDLLTLFQTVPTCNDLSLYHGRLVYSGIYNLTDGNTAYVSLPGQPEAIDSVTGIIQLDNNGLGIDVAHNYRDVLYFCKINQVVGYADNNDVPSSWLPAEIDEGIGAAFRGIGITGIYLGGTNIELLLVFDFNGVWIFNGTFQRPELSWKVHDYWKSSLTNAWQNIGYFYEMYNDPINTRIYIMMRDFGVILVGDYENGLGPMTIKWSKWTFSETLNCITLFDKTNKLIVCTSSGIHYLHEGTTFDNLYSGAVKIPNPVFITALLGD